MKKYEGLFILNTAGQEDSVQALVDSVGSEITSLGCKIESVQKMEKRAFARVANKRHKEGFYVNFIFTAEPEVAARLSKHFDLNDTVFRILVSHAAENAPELVPQQEASTT